MPSERRPATPEEKHGVGKAVEALVASAIRMQGYLAARTLGGGPDLFVNVKGKVFGVEVRYCRMKAPAARPNSGTLHCWPNMLLLTLAQFPRTAADVVTHARLYRAEPGDDLVMTSWNEMFPIRHKSRTRANFMQRAGWGSKLGSRTRA